MATSSRRIQCLSSTILPYFARPQHCTRQLHKQVSPKKIPPPTPFVPDPETFLKLIGRNLTQHAAKLRSWNALFSLSSAQLRELGVEPARTRRYLLWWRERFRNGIYGIGGDLQHVTNGTATLVATEKSLGRDEQGIERTKKLVINVLPDATDPSSINEQNTIKGIKVRGAQTITGPYVKVIKDTGGSRALIKVQEGMWEQKRGHKVDGGERRKVQVRRKRQLEESRNARK